MTNRLEVPRASCSDAARCRRSCAVIAGAAVTLHCICRSGPGRERERQGGWDWGRQEGSASSARAGTKSTSHQCTAIIDKNNH